MKNERHSKVRAPAPTLAGVGQEEVARVIAPYAWQAYDATLRPFVEGRGAHEGESWHVRAYLAGCRNAADARLWWQETADCTEPVTVQLFRDSLAKADAILALAARPAVGVEGWRMVPQAWIDRAMQIEAAADDLVSMVNQAIQRAQEGSGRLYAANIVQMDKRVTEVLEAIAAPEPAIPLAAAPPPPTAQPGDGEVEAMGEAAAIMCGSIIELNVSPEEAFALGVEAMLSAALTTQGASR